MFDLKSKLEKGEENMDVDDGECIHDFTWDVENFEKGIILDEYVEKVGVPVKCKKCGQKGVARFFLSHIDWQ